MTRVIKVDVVRPQEEKHRNGEAIFSLGGGSHCVVPIQSSDKKANLICFRWSSKVTEMKKRQVGAGHYRAA